MTHHMLLSPEQRLCRGSRVEGLP